MKVLAYLFAYGVMMEHLFICVLEMFFSQSRLAHRLFDLQEDFMKNPEYTILMANQGLYNGFLAMGLFWGLVFAPQECQHSILLFFLSCVLVAGIFGAVSVKRSILWQQALPALLGIIFLNFS